jgi:hypothetical protein
MSWSFEALNNWKIELQISSTYFAGEDETLVFNVKFDKKILSSEKRVWSM